MIRDKRGGYNRIKVNENFFKKWSPKMAYVLGFMFADGALLDTDKSSRTYYLHFSSNDLDLLEQIKKAIGSEHKIYMRPPRMVNHKNGYYLSKTSYSLRIGNKVIYQDLISLGMLHRKSNIMKLPVIPIRYFSYFLRGYFDGDGCINLHFKSQQTTPCLSIIFTSGSTAFLKDLSNKLSVLVGIKALNYYKSLGAYNLQAKGFRAIKIFNYMYDRLDFAPYMRRKYLKYIYYRDELIGPRIKKLLVAA